MKFKIGDRVSFLNEKGEGVICSQEKNGFVRVSIEDGFEIPYLVDELVKAVEVKQEADKKTKKDPRIASILREEQRTSEKAASGKQKYSGREEGIDLHIEELIDSHSGMTNAEIIRIQLSYFQKKLDEAIRKKKRKIVFIHGVGNGKLKQEIRKYIDHQEGMIYYDAPYHKYGFGATTVEIH